MSSIGVTEIRETIFPKSCSGLAHTTFIIIIDISHEISCVVYVYVIM